MKLCLEAKERWRQVGHTLRVLCIIRQQNATKKVNSSGQFLLSLLSLPSLALVAWNSSAAFCWHQHKVPRHQEEDAGPKIFRVDERINFALLILSDERYCGTPISCPFKWSSTAYWFSDVPIWRCDWYRVLGRPVPFTLDASTSSGFLKGKTYRLGPLVVDPDNCFVSFPRSILWGFWKSWQMLSHCRFR